MKPKKKKKKKAAKSLGRWEEGSQRRMDTGKPLVMVTLIGTKEYFRAELWLGLAPLKPKLPWERRATSLPFFVQLQNSRHQEHLAFV